VRIGYGIGTERDLGFVSARAAAGVLALYAERKGRRWGGEVVGDGEEDEGRDEDNGDEEKDIDETDDETVVVGDGDGEFMLTSIAARRGVEMRRRRGRSRLRTRRAHMLGQEPIVARTSSPSQERGYWPSESESEDEGDRYGRRTRRRRSLMPRPRL
jgi:hypothetical protein